MIIVTPDGISDADWDRVKALAVAILEATHDEDESGESETRALMNFLDDLESRCGTLPSILATRADFLDDPAQAVAMLERAYGLAVERDSARDRLYIADTLAGTYIRELEDADAGEAWLGRLADELKTSGDESDITSYEELRVDLQRLRDEA
jgi:hypothetical protein